MPNVKFIFAEMANDMRAFFHYWHAFKKACRSQFKRASMVYIYVRHNIVYRAVAAKSNGWMKEIKNVPQLEIKPLDDMNVENYYIQVTLSPWDVSVFAYN